MDALAHEEGSVTSCTELVIVCCHAFYRPVDESQDGPEAPTLEANWVLKPFQRSNPATHKISEHYTLLAHIRAGAAALRGLNVLLLFSGGKTDSNVKESEAETYFKAFTHLYATGKDVTDGNKCAPHYSRVGTEEEATDSYQNLIFSLCKFRKMTGRFPRKVTVITHAFKAKRFTDLHRVAIRWPEDRFEVIGINPPFSGDSNLASTLAFEDSGAVIPFTLDPYGVKPPLSAKRLQRQWKIDRLEQIAAGLEADIQDLLAWHGGEDGSTLYPGVVRYAHA